MFSKLPSKVVGVLFILLLVLFESSYAKIIGAFVLPHGGIALNPSRFETTSKVKKQEAWQIHRAAVEVGRHIQDLKPDLIFLSTPHGVADLNKFVFYLSGRGNGSAETDNCQCPPCCYTVDVKMDGDYSLKLAKDFAGQGMNVSGLSFFGPPTESVQPSVLRWGEVIPLLFVKDLRYSKVVIMSQPSRRYDESVSMVPELLSLGRQLYQSLESRPDKVVLIISSDLAHTHEQTGPYGWSPAADPFDKACGHWSATLHPTYLLEVAAQYVDKAKSCGYTGLVMLHGLMDAAKLSSWVPVMHANFHPSYYGMMVASFERKSNSWGTDDCPNCTV